MKEKEDQESIMASITDLTILFKLMTAIDQAIKSRFNEIFEMFNRAEIEKDLMLKVIEKITNEGEIQHYFFKVREHFICLSEIISVLLTGHTGFHELIDDRKVYRKYHWLDTLEKDYEVNVSEILEPIDDNDENTKRSYAYFNFLARKMIIMNRSKKTRNEHTKKVNYYNLNW